MAGHVVAICDYVATQQKVRPLAFGVHAARLSHGLEPAAIGRRGECADRAGVRAHAVGARVEHRAGVAGRRAGAGGATARRQAGKLAAHDAAIQQLLAEIRRLTQFPEPTRREIGFTAKWRDSPPASTPKKSR
jgi:hypothetical protein